MVTFGKFESIHLQVWKIISERDFSVEINLDLCSAVILNIKQRTKSLLWLEISKNHYIAVDYIFL